MDLVIKNVNQEQSDTIAAFAHAVKEESVEGIELFNDKEWFPKKNLNFFSTLNYRIKPSPSYLELHQKSGLKVGDRVKVKSNVVKEENGYQFRSRDKEDCAQNKGSYEGEITFDEGRDGFWVDGEYLLPYYALEKIEEEWIVKYKKEGVERVWGSIYPSKEAAEKEFREAWKTYGPFEKIQSVDYIKIK